MSNLTLNIQHSKLANAVSQSEKFPRKLKIKNSTLSNDGIVKTIEWYLEKYSK